ncbi:MAG TPA: type I-E CRISPR-associated endoribonuclease Cas2e [Roseiflexaceae bacterium]|nr:type I-E CRISPR-associated endoribonuclease Cas2e [Roseiflexaceae bacterium]
MTVIVLERVPVSVRGELTRWMLEIHAGVFIGRLSAMVRDVLWEYVCDQMREGAGWLVYQTNSEQGFGVRTCGHTDRRMIDVEGLLLVKIPS